MPGSSRSNRPAPTQAPAPAPSPLPPDLDPASPSNAALLERIAREGATHAPPPAPAPAPAPARGARPGVNPAGVGVTVGDWNIGVVPRMSTSDEHDNPQNEERARRAREEEVVERRNPRPASGPRWWESTPPENVAADPVFQAIQRARDERR